MGHLTLVVTVNTDGDDFATQRAQNGAFELVASVLEDRVAPRLHEGSNHIPIYDRNGNRAGVAELSEVID